MKKFIYSLAVLLALSGVAYSANQFYTHGSFPSPSSPATSSSMRAELDLISAGFDKLPDMSANPNKAVVVNAGGTALTVTSGAFALAGNLTTTGAFNTTLAQGATTTLTLPLVNGTLATLAGTETLTNKTITSPIGIVKSDVGLGNVDNTSDATKDAAAVTLTNKTITAPAISAPTFSGTAAGSLTNLALTTPAITSGVLTTSTVAADPSAALGVASKQYVDGAGFTTGDVKLTLKTTADSGFVLMDDKTIGDGSSGATGRANADTSALYTLIWTNVTNAWAPVTGGRGGSAAADFAAHKPLALPKTLGRALAGYGTGTVVASGVNADVDTAADTLTVASNNTKWITGMLVQFTLTSGTITGLTSGNSYYVIRSGTTSVQLSASLATAQNGTPIDLTAKSSPVWTITHTYTARVLGEAVGEQTHAMDQSELLSHTHSIIGYTGGGSPGIASVDNDNAATSGAAGGNSAMNITNPTLYLNVMVKLHHPWIELEGP